MAGKDTKPKKQRPSSTGGGPSAPIDQSNWRRKLQERRVKFDDHRKSLFIEHFSKTSRVMESCRVAGICLATYRKHLENDPEFIEMFEEAKMSYRDRCHAHADMLMFEGVDKPQIGGKFKDEIICYVKEYSVPLLQMELRRVDPSYKERSEVELNATGGGVLVVPADKTPQQWIEEQQKLNEQREKPGSDGDGA